MSIDRTGKKIPQILLGKSANIRLHGGLFNLRIEQQQYENNLL